jgi:hypothetical protein
MEAQYRIHKDSTEELDKEELCTLAQLLLMSRIREHTNKEYISIIDAVISCEYDNLNDFVLENNELL